MDKKQLGRAIRARARRGMWNVSLTSGGEKRHATMATQHAANTSFTRSVGHAPCPYQG